MRIHRRLAAVGLLAWSAACAGLAAEEDKFAEVPSGTSLTVRLDGGIDTRTTQVGQAISGSVVESVVHSGETLIPAGSPVRGVVTAISENPPALTVQFDQIEIRGASYALEARPAGATLTKHSEMRDEGAKIGGGAAAGALLGGVIGGNVKGAVIGAAAGAAAGTGVAVATKAHWASLPAGSTLHAQLESSLRIPVLPKEPPQAD
ncbi:MAG: hypothetical protein ACE5JR_09930 [Gemmatimonadota bacterium]